MEMWHLKAWWFNLMGVGRGKELLGLSLEWWGLKGLWLGWWAMEYLAVGWQAMVAMWALAELVESAV
jgi:hypothetical protein